LEILELRRERPAQLLKLCAERACFFQVASGGARRPCRHCLGQQQPSLGAPPEASV
jgi:hypothetical protein